jgi:hypothetical protein
VTAQSVALQPGDVAGLLRCDTSGDVEAVLRYEQANEPTEYQQNALEWARWKSIGATQGYFAIYGRSQADCNAMSGAAAGAPPGGLMAGLVVKFKNEATAARIYRGAAPFLGFGPRDMTFIKVAGGNLTMGPPTGLGQESTVGSALVVGNTYFFAFWQRKVFDSFLLAYDVQDADAERAVQGVNRRIT